MEVYAISDDEAATAVLAWQRVVDERRAEITCLRRWLRYYERMLANAKRIEKKPR